MRPRVLHITNWYHSSTEPFKVPFIKEHFEALNLFTEGFLIHVEVTHSNKHWFLFRKEFLSDKEVSYTIQLRVINWFMIEVLTGLLMMLVCIRYKANSFDTVNVHTGYPLLTFRFIHWLIRKPLMLVEHWTAFHYNFNLPKNTTKLDRIKDIYRRHIPLVAVSERLARDIEEFAGVKQNFFVLPNVVDNKIFFLDDQLNRDPNRFFMVNHWRRIKSPMEIFEGFMRYLEHHPQAQLRVGGYGELWPEMVAFVDDNHLHANIKLLGPLTKRHIALEMQHAAGFFHAAQYETFSVVCAEAISCGCPVLVSYLDAVAEFIEHGKNGYLKRKEEDWAVAMKRFQKLKFDYNALALHASNKFDQRTVGEQYLQYNLNLLN